MYYDWNQRQWKRAEDWWPKDQSEIIYYLLQNLPSVSGTWPVVNPFYVDFNYAEAKALQCGVTTLISDAVYPSGSNFVFGIDYVPNDDEIIFSLDRPGTEPTHNSLFAVDVATDTVTPFSTAKILSPAITVSINNPNDVLYVMVDTGGANRAMYGYNATTKALAYNQANPLGSGNTLYPLAENDDYIGLKQLSVAAFAVMDKAWAFTSIGNPSGWTMVDQSAGKRSATSFIVPLKETSSGNYALFSQAGTSAIAIGDKLADCDVNITQFVSTGLNLSNKLFWMVNYDDGAGADYAAILVTDTDGTQLALKEVVTGSDTWSGGQTYWRLAPESGGGYVWWFEGATVYRMDASTYDIESCAPDPTASRIEFSAAAYERNNYVYIADAQAFNVPTTATFRVLAKTEALV